MKTKGIFLGDVPKDMEAVWGPSQRARLAEWVDFPAGPLDTASLPHAADWLAGTEVVFSTWGMPKLTDDQLALMPRLRAVFYAAGTVKKFSDPLLERGITIVSAWEANAIPVAEFALAEILFSLKLGWRHIGAVRRRPGIKGWQRLPVPGNYGSTVGIVSLGTIGRKLSQLLRPFDLRKLAYDPHANEALFRELDMERVGLETLFSRSDAVTIHTPWLKETEGMVTGPLLASMKPDATFINTSRGALVNEGEMIEVLKQRPDLTVVLDVTRPEPPDLESELYSLPNVVLTPHIAGSMGNEVHRMADFMIEEFLAWKAGRPMRYAVTAEMLTLMA